MATSLKQENKLEPIGSLINQVFKIYQNNFGLFIGYGAWMLIPLVISIILTVSFGSSIESLNSSITAALDIVIASWIVISIIQIGSLLDKNKKIDTRKISAASWHLIVPFLLLFILLSLITVVGLVLLIIPGIIFSVWFAFATVILILEKETIIGSLKASKGLVKNRFWSIFGRLLGGNIVLSIPYLLISAVIFALLIFLQGGDIEIFMSSAPTLMEQVLLRVIDILFLPIFILFNVLLYQTANKTR